MKIDLDKVIKDARKSFEAHVGRMRREFETMIENKKAEAEVANALPQITDADDFLVRDIEAGGLPYACTHVEGYLCAQMQNGQVSDPPLGRFKLPAGKYRAIVMFFKREG